MVRATNKPRGPHIGIGEDWDPLDSSGSARTGPSTRFCGATTRVLTVPQRRRQMCRLLNPGALPARTRLRLPRGASQPPPLRSLTSRVAAARCALVVLIAASLVPPASSGVEQVPSRQVAPFGILARGRDPAAPSMLAQRARRTSSKDPAEGSFLGGSLHLVLRGGGASSGDVLDMPSSESRLGEWSFESSSHVGGDATAPVKVVESDPESQQSTGNHPGGNPGANPWVL